MQLLFLRVLCLLCFLFQAVCQMQNMHCAWTVYIFLLHPWAFRLPNASSVQYAMFFIRKKSLHYVVHWILLKYVLWIYLCLLIAMRSKRQPLYVPELSFFSKEMFIWTFTKQDPILCYSILSYPTRPINLYWYNLQQKKKNNRYVKVTQFLNIHRYLLRGK